MRWHQRVGHINHQSLDVLRKDPAIGVDFTGNVKNCTTCPLGKNFNNLTPSRPRTMFYVLSRSCPSTSLYPSRANLWAGSNTPSGSLTCKPSERRWCS